MSSSSSSRPNGRIARRPPRSLSFVFLRPVLQGLGELSEHQRFLLLGSAVASAAAPMLVEDAVDELARVGGAEALRELDRLVDDDARAAAASSPRSSKAPIRRMLRSMTAIRCIDQLRARRAISASRSAWRASDARDERPARTRRAGPPSSSCSANASNGSASLAPHVGLVEVLERELAAPRPRPARRAGRRPCPCGAARSPPDLLEQAQHLERDERRLGALVVRRPRPERSNACCSFSQVEHAERDGLARCRA